MFHSKGDPGVQVDPVLIHLELEMHLEQLDPGLEDPEVILALVVRTGSSKAGEGFQILDGLNKVDPHNKVDSHSRDFNSKVDSHSRVDFNPSRVDFNSKVDSHSKVDSNLSRVDFNLSKARVREGSPIPDGSNHSSHLNDQTSNHTSNNPDQDSQTPVLVKIQDSSHNLCKIEEMVDRAITKPYQQFLKGYQVDQG